MDNIDNQRAIESEKAKIGRVNGIRICYYSTKGVVSSMEKEQIVKMLETVLDSKLKPIKDDISDIKQDVRYLIEKLDLLALRATK
ncbi:hypothetical protein KP014_17895 [Paenibacillus sophorae]|uniref:Spo0E like sporulation regulatory protein n=2 Tax=Paenibacillus sophorae TaxID=1333845 RepID=A0ABX8H7B3_9BACL|nr:hypothetical protein [Paenibacillus sophorae]QWU13829.1 hypothetical protein KP014_17895 [Paenibacillus sophorae]